jgi:hypothetical protein
MGLLVEQILQTAAMLGIKTEIVDSTIVLELIQSMRTQYGTDASAGHRFLWEELLGGTSLHDPRGWEVLQMLPMPHRIIMFFNQHEEQQGLLFQSVDDIAHVLAEMIGFEFFLINETGDFLLSFNHHDVLSGWGHAASWVNQLTKLRANRNIPSIGDGNNSLD